MDWISWAWSLPTSRADRLLLNDAVVTLAELFGGGFLVDGHYLYGGRMMSGMSTC
jgi:hypothetical protein